MSDFKDHFSSHALQYAAARPSYPEALFEWIASQCERRELVIDAGCGNGQASIALSAYFDQVYASDPSANQIANAPAHPGIRYLVEVAERCSLPDSSADCLCVAQALHWFDAHRFFAEAKRVLKKGGLLVAWTYEKSSVSEKVDALFERLYRDELMDYWPPERRHVENGYRDIEFPPHPIVAPHFAMECHWNLPQYLAYLRSWSASQRYLTSTGIDAISLHEDEMRIAWEKPDMLRRISWPLTVKACRV